MNLRALYTFVIALILCGCSSRLPSSKPRIGVDPTWTPLDFGKQTSYVNGFTEELLMEIAHRNGVEWEKVPANWDTLFSGLKEKKYEAVLSSLPPYSFHLAKYDFTQNFLDIGPVLIVKVNSPYKKLDQMKEESIGILSGDPAEQILRPFPDIVVRSYLSVPDLLDALAEEEVGGVLLGKLLAVNYIRDLYQGRLKIVSPPLTKAGLHLIVEKGKQGALIESFDEGLKHLKKKKRLKSLLRKWSL